MFLRDFNPHTSFLKRKKEVAVIWLSEKGEKAAVTTAYKTEGNAWSAPELLSSWDSDILDTHTCFVHLNGDISAAWGAVNDEDDEKVYVAEKKAGGNWSRPLTCFNLEDFECDQFRFDAQGQLLCVGLRKSESKFSFEKMRFLPAIHNDFALGTMSTIASKESWSFLKLSEDSSYDLLGFELNKSGDLYLLSNECNGFGAGNKLIRRKIENNQFASSQTITNTPYIYRHRFQAKLNGKGTTVIAYPDQQRNNVVVVMDESSCSTPFTLSVGEESDYDEPILSIDEEGNVFAVCVIKDGTIKTAFKPAGQPWHTPTLFNMSKKNPNGDIQIKPDNNGNFVMIWAEQVLKHSAIMGATFSTASETWSEPTLLSPEGIRCYGFEFDFWAPGKGYISWTTRPTKFESRIQVAELCN